MDAGLPPSSPAPVSSFAGGFGLLTFSLALTKQKYFPIFELVFIFLYKISR